jgi:hypothetical protein
MPGPIKPEDVQDKRNESIPEPVFEAFNELIVREWALGSANFTLTEVANLAIEKLRKTDESFKDLTRQQMYDKGWMDVEPAYRKAGWKVEFDKPGWEQSYDANFTFSK